MVQEASDQDQFKKLCFEKELNEILRRFYAEIKTEKGQPLTASALPGIRAVIHRHMTSAPLSRNVNILQENGFMSTNKMLEAKAKSLHNLALYIDDSNKDMTFVVHIVYLWPL